MDIGRCLTKVKVTTSKFSPFTTIQTVKSSISALAPDWKLLLSMSVHVILIYNMNIATLNDLVNCH